MFMKKQTRLAIYGFLFKGEIRANVVTFTLLARPRHCCRIRIARGAEGHEFPCSWMIVAASGHRHRAKASF